MKKNLILAAFAFAFAHGAFAITATKAYVDGATNATLAAAKEYADDATNATLRAAKDYTDTHGGSSGAGANVLHYSRSTAAFEESAQTIAKFATTNQPLFAHVDGYLWFKLDNVVQQSVSGVQTYNLTMTCSDASNSATGIYKPWRMSVLCAPSANYVVAQIAQANMLAENYTMLTNSASFRDAVNAISPPSPVRSVNGKTGSVSLTYSDVGAKNFFTVGRGLAETTPDALYGWRYYYYRTQYNQYFTKSPTPSNGDRLYDADGSVIGPDWRIVVSYDAQHNTILITDYGSNFTASRYAADDIPANPMLYVTEAMPENGVILTNGTLATKSGTSVGASAVGAATTAYVDTANASTRAIVETWEGFLDGSNVVFSITNYISGAYNLGAAKLRILEMRDGAYREVYNSRGEIVMHIDDFRTNEFCVATNGIVTSVDAKISGKADKAWGNYTSAGNAAPSNTVYMTAPYTVFAGGMEYERVAVGEGAVCILTTKGAPTYTTGDEGTFKFQDDGGTNYFGFAKTDSYTLGCHTDGISVSSGIVTLEYDVTMSGVPCIWYCASLDVSPIVWERLNNSDGSPVPGASHTVTWEASPPAGKEICYLNCANEASGFFKATIEVAGSAKFMTNMPADLSGGIICTNTSQDVMGIIRPTFNGSAVQWNWSAQ